MVRRGYMLFPAARPVMARSRPSYQAQIDENGDDHNGQVKAHHGSAAVDRPRIRQSRQWHEEEAEERPERRLVGSANVVAEEDDEADGKPRRRKRQASDQERHDAKCIRKAKVEAGWRPASTFELR